MTALTIGFLHPGAMGSVLASCCVAENRLWVEDGRSGATRERAESAGLIAVSSLSDLASEADVVVSICPPAAATEVAQDIVSAGFGGIYVDANAIAPERSREIARLFEKYVDASVVGPPPTSAGTTRLFLSGPAELTNTVGQLWQGTNLEARSIGIEPGEASALKMAYAGWTKGSAALLLAVSALAESEGVADALHAEWELSQPQLLGQLEASATRAAPKAWRFAGEMYEIAATFDSVGLPNGFHVGAAQIYERLAEFKDGAPTTVEVLTELASTEDKPID
jgi:3-hydroxyisobutyrate dehydrogenase-like beta-hydroxyacid dehydrogenase